jgi:hypothetical protein
METTLNLAAAEQAAELGAQLAANHADNENPSWTERALAYFVAYAKARPTSAFLTEDVRFAASLDGLPPPPDRRAWGYIPKAAQAQGVIAHAGYARQKAANCHASPKSLWRLAA